MCTRRRYLCPVQHCKQMTHPPFGRKERCPPADARQSDCTWRNTTDRYYKEKVICSNCLSTREALMLARPDRLVLTHFLWDPSSEPAPYRLATAIPPQPPEETNVQPQPVTQLAPSMPSHDIPLSVSQRPQAMQQSAASRGLPYDQVLDSQDATVMSSHYPRGVSG